MAPMNSSLGTARRLREAPSRNGPHTNAASARSVSSHGRCMNLGSA